MALTGQTEELYHFSDHNTVIMSVFVTSQIWGLAFTKPTKTSLRRGGEKSELKSLHLISTETCCLPKSPSTCQSRELTNVGTTEFVACFQRSELQRERGDIFMKTGAKEREILKCPTWVLQKGQSLSPEGN